MIRGLLFKHVDGWDKIPDDDSDPRRYASVTVGALVPVILYPDTPCGDTHLKALYEAIGCDMVERVVLDASGAAAELYIDEEGLLRQAPPNRMWSYVAPTRVIKDWYKILGHAVAVGVDRDRGVLRTPTLEEALRAVALTNQLGDDKPPNVAALQRWLVAGLAWPGATVVEAGPRPRDDARPIDLYPTPRGRA